jgi:MFS family permease
MERTDAASAEPGGAWKAVFAGAIGLMMSFGSIGVYTFTVFLKPLTESFGWSRGAVSFAFTVACLAALGSILLIGRFVDRVGGRVVALTATALFGVFFGALGLITGHIWQLYALFVCLGLVGAGTAAIAYSSVVSRWFDERRGLALGLTMAGLGVGSAAAPSVAQALIDYVTWRGAYAVFGGAILLVACPIMFAWFREPASALSAGGSRADGPLRVGLTGVTAGKAMRGSTIWILFAALLLVSAGTQGCLIHLVPLLTDGGISPERAAFAASLFGVTNLLGRLAGGYLLDRVFAPYVVVTCLAGAAIGIGLLFVGPQWAFVATTLMGLGMGVETDAVPYLVGRYFGLRSFGEIYSYLFLTVPLGGAVGPLLVGLGFDATGSYSLPLGLCAAGIAASALLLTRLGAYPAASGGPVVASGATPTLDPVFGTDGD